MKKAKCLTLKEFKKKMGYIPPQPILFKPDNQCTPEEIKLKRSEEARIKSWESHDLFVSVILFFLLIAAFVLAIIDVINKNGW